ncbi:MULTISPECIES: C39 family peptidase [unclassified Paenibacillus]|uniref:C39 family peptidase n=1 Tax=unclassified Paenibacillus TaxID=185978 RepID=UPI001AE13DBD|nr:MULTISPECIES: C39 family peptidase [unclassified Paenibacillus]MBP1155825.1 uncharacterized protein YvpB [Paenibacillus sp. PvP091]MBP1168789.1 uncharacterized protein YvpB [Paenibacillus sp. PvR098]MBP2439817.1 uncharacterized protein YvpB [Paenibacillus sp. PvP052]
MILRRIKTFLGALLLIGLAFSSAIMLFLLYMKIIDNNEPPPIYDSFSPAAALSDMNSLEDEDNRKKLSAMIDAPIIMQKPELFNGCEITALTMLFQYKGIKKNKMELVPEMKKDSTTIQYNPNGTIKYWGNPNLGFVGDVTGKQKGLGIYHAALSELLLKYIPTGVDLTGSSFDDLERQVSNGIPVLVWTTVSFTVPADKQWVVWDTSIGPIRTTFQEHTVLLVGYDEKNVYVNDPLSGRKQLRIEKERFIATWEALGKQALSYTE